MKRLFALLLLSQGMVLSSFGYAPGNIEPFAGGTSAPALVSAYVGTRGSVNTMVAGGTLQMIAYGIYSDGSVGTLPDSQGNVVTGWNTSNHNVAKIAGKGYATGVSPGTVNMEATIGTLVASPWTVTVSKAPFNPNAPTLVSVRLGTNGNVNTMVAGRTLQIIAYSTYSNGSAGTLPDPQGNAVTAWNTSNHAVAKINSVGDATALGAGTVNMEATIGTFVASPWPIAVSAAPVTVVPPPTISCSANPSIIHQGGTAVITAAGSSPKNLALTYSYSASAGSISGTNTTASLQTSGASAGIVTVTCTVDQQGGGTASATTKVLLQSVTGEQALSNFQFTDSVGVNVHLSYGDTVYAEQFPQIMQSMISLGIKHYRDGLNQSAPSFQYENAEMLGKAGIKADWLMDFNNSASIINSAYANAPDATAGFEGPNEDDAEAGPRFWRSCNCSTIPFAAILLRQRCPSLRPLSYNRLPLQRKAISAR